MCSRASTRKHTTCTYFICTYMCVCVYTLIFENIAGINSTNVIQIYNSYIAIHKINNVLHIF